MVMKKKQVEKIHVIRLTDDEFATIYEALIGYECQLNDIRQFQNKDKIFTIECKRTLKEVYKVLEKFR